MGTDLVMSPNIMAIWLYSLAFTPHTQQESHGRAGSLHKEGRT